MAPVSRVQRFRDRHRPYIQEQRSWNDVESNRCLNFIWYEIVLKAKDGTNLQYDDDESAAAATWDHEGWDQWIPANPPTEREVSKAERRRKLKARIEEARREAELEAETRASDTGEADTEMDDTGDDGAARAGTEGTEHRTPTEVATLREEVKKLQEENHQLREKQEREGREANDYAAIAAENERLCRENSRKQTLLQSKFSYMMSADEGDIEVGKDTEDDRPILDVSVGGESTDREIEKRQWQRLFTYPHAMEGFDFMSDESGTWRPAQVLGKGGYGRVVLWVKVDAREEVVDRIAIKQHDQWDHSGSWRDPLVWRDRLPVEISVLKQLNETVPQFPYFPRLFGYRINPAQCRYHMYLEYMPHGDLRKVVELYDTGTKDEPANPVAYRDKDVQHSMPVEFCFYVFLSLVEACLILHQGSVDEPVEGWVSIVHNDIKPSNVFLAPESRDSDDWYMYPTPVLADFGLAFENLEDDPNNPSLYIGRGTLKYAPPETRKMRPVPQKPRITDRSNVYAIGATVFDLVTEHSWGPWYLGEEKNSEAEDTATGVLVIMLGRWDTEHLLQDPKFAEGPWATLRDILRPCVEFDPDDRPSLHVLREQLQDAIKNHNLSPADDYPPLPPYEHSQIFRGRVLYPDDHAPGNEEARQHAFGKWKRQYDQLSEGHGRPKSPVPLARPSKRPKVDDGSSKAAQGSFDPAGGLEDFGESVMGESED